MAAAEVFAQLAVEHREQFFSLDAWLSPADLVEAAGGDIRRIEPDPIVGPDPQM